RPAIRTRGDRNPTRQAPGTGAVAGSGPPKVPRYLSVHLHRAGATAMTRWLSIPRGVPVHLPWRPDAFLQSAILRYTADAGRPTCAARARASCRTSNVTGAALRQTT